MDFLKKDDSVALVCPASTWQVEQRTIDAKNYLKEKYRLNAVYQEDVFQGVSAERKAEIFLEYLFDDDIKAILSIKGGEGSADIIPYLHQHQDKLKQLQPKWFVGFSDTTALLMYFSRFYHWPVVHGPSVMRIMEGSLDKDSEKYLYDLLLGCVDVANINEIKPLNAFAKEAKTIEAQIIGGCLSLINVSIKDLWEIDAKNKIIILEDTGEKAHVISRTLKYLQRVGAFDGAVAIIFGSFERILGLTEEVKKNNQQIGRVLAWFANQCQFPVFKTNQFGHGRMNHPIVFSRPAMLDGKRQRLTCWL